MDERRFRLHCALLGAAVLASVLVAPTASAQLESLYDFRVSAESSRVDIQSSAGSGQGFLRGIVEDRSKDPPYPLLPGGTGPAIIRHQVLFEAIPAEKLPGWQVGTPTADKTGTIPGETLNWEAPITFNTQAKSAFYPFSINVTIRSGTGSEFHYTVQAMAYAIGLPTFNMIGTGATTLAPRGITNLQYDVSNLAFEPQTFNVAVTDNPCNLRVAMETRVLVDGKQGQAGGKATIPFTVQAPEGIYLLGGSTCALRVTLGSDAKPGETYSATYQVTIEGFGPSPTLYFWILFIVLVILLLIFLVRRSRQKLESRILGKPEKPWLIPVEAVYLKALKQKDPQAWHVVRHHLMEDEYRSSLLWYAAYKKGTKGSRKKERLVIKHEDRFAKWKAAWQKAIAKPLRKADRFEAKLQRKLDRKARKNHRKALKAWRKGAAKATAKADKAYAKALAKHTKAAAKARKKGLPEPAAPAVPQVGRGAEPELVPLSLREHRWSKKAARFRRRKVKKQGNLEVTFEKQEARYLDKLRRKVQKIARKLDDPDFVSEHPLLARTA